MADRYNHWFPKLYISLFRPVRGDNGKLFDGWGITIGQTTYYSVSQSQVDDAWRRHEECHKKQWKREGWFWFPVKYIFSLIAVGYWDNPFEIEARREAQNGN